jgi:GNAT superfamily N-acetyltransferase
MSAIRRATAEDVERLDELYPEPVSRNGERLDLQTNGDGVYLLAWRDQGPVGWVFVHRPGSPASSERSMQAGVAQIEDLYVHEAFRGHGDASALLAAAEDEARTHGWSRVGLSVTVANRHNDVARAMYERHGYRDDGSGPYDGGYWYWTDTGEKRWDAEPYRFIIKDLADEG